MSAPSKEAIGAVGELMRETNIFPNQVGIAKQIVQSAIDKATEELERSRDAWRNVAHDMTRKLKESHNATPK
jgi:predicted phosphoribosyltransferase